MPRSALWSVLLVGYLCLMALMLYGLRIARARVIADLDTPAAQAAWQRWAEQTKQPAGPDQPVARRPVKSQEPPALILMRDHFRAVQSLAVIIATFLCGFFAFLVRGILRGSRPTIAERGVDD